MTKRMLSPADVQRQDTDMSKPDEALKSPSRHEYDMSHSVTFHTLVAQSLFLEHEWNIMRPHGTP